MVIVANGASAQKTSSNSSTGFVAGLNARLSQPVNPFAVKTILPGNFYTKNLGFFCKQELKFEAVTKVPLKFRLGSVQECDRLEGKGNVRLVD